MVAASILVSRYPALVEALTVITRSAKSTKPLPCNEPAKSFLKTSVLERLAEHLEDVPPELRAFVQEAHAMVRQRPLARPRDLAATDQPHIRDGVMRGAKRPRGAERRAVAGEAGDAEVMHASCQAQSVSSRPGRFHPHGQRHQLMQIN
jgi:hypothetical protein